MGQPGSRPICSSRWPVAARGAYLACGERDVTAGIVTSPPCVPPDPRAMLWRTLCVQVCQGMPAPPSVALRSPWYMSPRDSKLAVYTHEARGPAGSPINTLPLLAACR